MEYQDLQQQISASIYRLQNYLPLIGTFLVNIPHQIVGTESPIKTAAIVCHGNSQPALSLVVNGRFWSSLPGPKDQDFLCLHECLHILCRHVDIARTNHYSHPGLYNIAADLVVNFLASQHIKSHYLMKRGITCQAMGWPTNLPLGLYYQKLNNLHTSDSKDDMLRRRILSNALADSNSIQASHSHWSKTPNPKLEQQLNECWQKTCQQLGSEQIEIGKLPGYIQRQWGGSNHHDNSQQMNWSQLLDYFRIQIESRQLSLSPQRPSKRFGSGLPGLRWRHQLQKICVALDLSGSISNQQLEQFWHLLRQLSAQLSNLDITVICFDQKVLKVFNMDQLNQRQIRCLGGGGSDLTPVLQAIQQGEIEGIESNRADNLVVFSDGRVRLENLANKYTGQIMWIISPNGIKPNDELWQHLPGKKVQLSDSN